MGREKHHNQCIRGKNPPKIAAELCSRKVGFSYPSTNTTPLIQSCQNVSDFRVSDLPTDTLEQRIRYVRVLAGMSCADVSRAIGVHRDSYLLFEKKADRIHPHRFLRLCLATGADPSFVLYGSSPPPLVPLTGDTIGARIREYRMSTGLSARQFGYRVIGAKRTSSVNSWESGFAMPELRGLMMIANAFGINAASFLVL